MYRNFDHDWEDLPQVGTIGVNQPVLFIGGRRDPAVFFTQEWIDPMVNVVPNLQRDPLAIRELIPTSESDKETRCRSK